MVKYEAGKTIVLKTPPEWIDILRDIDFSLIENKAIKAEVYLRNFNMRSGYGMRFDDFGGRTIMVSIERDTTTSRVNGTIGSCFDSSRFQFPPGKPSYLSMNIGSVGSLRNALNYLSQADMAGYDLPDDFNFRIKTGGEFPDHLLALSPRTTEIYLAPLIFQIDKEKKIWIPKNNLEFLIKTYGEC